jgi:Zn-dependent metalloprotease
MQFFCFEFQFTLFNFINPKKNHTNSCTMKQQITLLFSASLLTSVAFAQQTFNGTEADKICSGAKTVMLNEQSKVPSFIVFAGNTQFASANIIDHLRGPLKMNIADGWKSIRTEKDELNFTHYRYQQTYNSIPVDGGVYLVHERNGRVESVNGMWMDGITINTNASLTESSALAAAMNHIGASKYKWEIPGEDNLLKRIKNDPNASWLPKGELLVVCNNNDLIKRDYRLAWKFDIYAAAPVSRNHVYVDAHTGEIILMKNQLCAADVAASGSTYYSGNQNFTCDNFAANQYRLREVARGQGIETYNCQQSTNTGNAVDFTNGSVTWTNTANDDHCGRDAHWGAEKTYDYYLTQHNRNSLDDNGVLLVSYVHYDNGLDNAYWDGTSMQYGDGSQQSGGFNPLVAIDVCGHEFTHGLTQYTAGLDYQDESGALNESYSDIFGTCVEHYAKFSTFDYLIGEEITVNAGTALRDMADPNNYGDPDTYMGTNYYTGTADNGGVHTNSGVQNKWFYILSAGETGTNDNSDAYSVTGIGVPSAASVAFRCLTVYLINSSQYADARTYSIQAANDLYGACSPEVIATTNAWYAVGVGAQFSATVAASFTADLTSICTTPATVNFTNTSSNATNATWYFGDNTTSTQTNPSHTYTAPGLYTVSLAVNSACGNDSTTQVSYINVNPPALPVSGGDPSSCSAQSFTLTATGNGSLEWFTQSSGGTPVGSGTSYTTPVIGTTTTYYVENQITQPPGFTGATDNNFGTGGQHNNTSTQYLEFTVAVPCTLITADVYAGSSGNKTFTVWDSQGNQLNQYTVNVPGTGLQNITLNIPFTPGSYRIGGTQMNLYRNNSGASYPYSLPGVLDITGSSAGGAFYYYLYNWEVSQPSCNSGRVPVTCTVGPLNVSFSTAAYDSVCLSDGSFALTGATPTGGTFTGPGVSNGNFDPTTAGAGVHAITYTYTDTVLNCTATATQNIYVDACAGIFTPVAANTMSVYPNPAQSQLNLELNLLQSQNVTISMFDMLGQSVYASQQPMSAGANTVRINTSNLPRGVYFLEVISSSGRQVKRIELQ